MILNSGAKFSPCKKWRYTLWRVWDERKPYVLFLMLNPSTADETKNDPTVERCQRYASAWGYGGLYVCNIFAYRATDPKVMKSASDPIGPENDQYIVNTAMKAAIVVCAWGNHGQFMGRSMNVFEMLNKSGIYTHCLTVTKAGEPGHPLYLKKNLKPRLMNVILKEVNNDS